MADSQGGRGGPDSQYDILIQLTPHAHTNTYTPDKNPAIKKKSNKWMNLRNHKIFKRHSGHSQSDSDNLSTSPITITLFLTNIVRLKTHFIAVFSWYLDLQNKIIMTK